MDTPIVITLIICGTIVLITVIALLFTAWVIRKGIAMSEKNR
ncbi:MAG: hypothetical protein WCV91_06715 [Candidatus Margulisiibacteriota bacterium]